MNRKNKPQYVFVVKRNGKPYRYMVRRIIDNTRHYIGCFKTVKEAVDAHDQYMRDLESYTKHMGNLLYV
jgi:transposase